MKQQMKITIGLATCVVMALSASAQDAELRIQACLENTNTPANEAVRIYLDGEYQGETDTNGCMVLEVAATQVTAPAVLELDHTDGIRIGLSGRGGKSCVVQRAREMCSGNWDDCFAVTLPSNGVGTVEIPDDAGGYYRLSTAGLGEEHEVRAVWPRVAGGAAVVYTEPGSTTEVAVVMDSRGLIAEADLKCDQIAGGILDTGTTNLIFRFENAAGSLCQVAEVLQAWLDTGSGEAEYDAAQFAVAADGGVRHVVPAEFIRYVRRFDGEVTLQLDAMDSEGQAHSGAVVFRIGQHAATGVVLVPESLSGLALDELTVRAELLGTEIGTETPVDAAGIFAFGNLPAGLLSFTVEATWAGEVYRAVAFGRGEEQLELVMNMSGSNSGTRSRATSRIARKIENLRMETVEANDSEMLAWAKASNVETAMVCAGEAGVTVSAEKEFAVAANVKMVNLRYKVHTAEYPDAIAAQSRHDDIWGVEVTVDGVLRFYVQMDVNSQLDGEPRWGDDGSTGWITVPLDVEDQTKGKSATIRVRVFAANIYDGYKPTRVWATIASVAEGLAIQQIQFPALGASYPLSNVVSIPRHKNITDKWIMVTYTPTSAPLDKVSVEMVQGGTSKMKVMDAAPSASNLWATIVRPGQLKLMTAIKGGECSIDQSGGPPFQTFQYRVTLTSAPNRAAAVSPTAQALWRMPSQITERFGVRDVGLDDWCSKGTYEWLEENAELVTVVNDISGEHGKNIGHAGHKDGHDVDMFSFVNLLEADKPLNGTMNYLAISQLTRRALDGETNAVPQVAGWIQTHRVELAKLLAKPEVRIIYVCSGSVNSCGLPANWHRALLVNGVLSQGTKSLQLGLGTWNPPGAGKMRYDSSATHNHHIHVGLDKAKLNDAP